MQLRLLTSGGFLFGLTLLLINDFVLKAQFHNWFTGKLSDFAGLFIFPLFWTAFFPKRERLIFAITALGFVLWKSPLSESLIHFWNSWPFGKITRVVDYTDFLALVMLPLAYAYKSPRSLFQCRYAPQMAAVLSIFAFGATSCFMPYVHDLPEGQHHYHLTASGEEVARVINENYKARPPLQFSEMDSATTQVTLNITPACSFVEVDLYLIKYRGETDLHLRRLTEYCLGRESSTEAALLAGFELDFIDPVKRHLTARPESK